MRFILELEYRWGYEGEPEVWRMKRLNEEQAALLYSMGLPSSFDKMTDNELMVVEDALADEMQTNGLNDAGDGLSEYGELCRSIIVAMPD